MKAIPRLRAAAIALAMATMPVASAQQASPTRGVVVFTGLESELAGALRAGNHAEVDRLLAADFEQRTAASVERPQPRAEWLAAEAGASVAATSGMAVHDYGDTAVASFHADVGATGAAIIDIWRRHGDGWQLQLRFVAPVTADAAPEDRKPDGKD